MKTPLEVEKYYYREVGTFIDLVCQREMSCAKIILVATKVDRSSWLPWLHQPHGRTFSAILQRTKDHISYLKLPRNPQTPVIFLFDEVLATSAQSVSQEQIGFFHKVVSAMVTGVKPLPKVPIPQCWITWLQFLRRNPIVTIAELEPFPDSNDSLNLSDDQVEKLTFLKSLIVVSLLQGSLDSATHTTIFEKEIPQGLIAPIKFFRAMTDILWYKEIAELRHLIITDPMHLIRALRSLLNHNVRSSFDKGDPDSSKHYKSLTQQGKITFDVFQKIYKESEFTAKEAWSFLTKLDIACPINSDGSLVFIPALISDEMHDRFVEKLAEVKRSRSSMCIEYTFRRGMSSVGMFNKLLSRFAQTFKIGDTGGSIEVAFLQKVEKRMLEITAGVFGAFGLSKEKDTIFLVHEYEIVDDDLLELKELAHPVHRGIRTYLQHKAPFQATLPYTGKLIEVMKKVHECFLMDTLPSPRLICPTCLSQVERKEGFYDMDSHLALVSDLQIAACSTNQHELPRSVRGAFSGAFSRAGWGVQNGTEDDEYDLNEIITAELRKTGNQGDLLQISHIE